MTILVHEPYFVKVTTKECQKLDHMILWTTFKVHENVWNAHLEWIRCL